MHQWGGAGFNTFGGATWFAAFAPFLILFVLWSLLWKGLGLWHAGRRGDAWWFVILLFVNTLGILEIIYLFAVAKLHWNELFSKHEHKN